MTALWTYFWPVFAAGLIAGAAAETVAFWRRDRRRPALAAGLAVALAAAALWHGPLGAADRFAAEVERSARRTLDDYEMTQVAARLHRAPLSRRLVLSGPADDFQTARLIEIMGAQPGVSRAQWTAAPAGPPLIAESLLVSAAGFLSGLVLAYLVALRRRFNTQWNW